MLLWNKKKAQLCKVMGMDRYLGKWLDDIGKIMFVRKNNQGYLVDYYVNQDLPAKRELLGGVVSESVDMKAFISGSNWEDINIKSEDLLVELGTEGLGPFMCLKYKKEKDTEYLLPSVFHGLYDEWEDDLGVPWVFPLKAFRK